MFNIPLSKWQEEKITKNGASYENDTKKLLQTMYNETQENFKKDGIETVTLYRGIKGKN